MKKRASKRRFVWRSLKSFSLAKLRKMIGKEAAWDSTGWIGRKYKDVAWTPCIIKKFQRRKELLSEFPACLASANLAA